MRTPEEIRLEIIGLYLERKKWGVAKYQEKANSILESYAKEVAEAQRAASVETYRATVDDNDYTNTVEIALEDTPLVTNKQP